MFKVGDEVRVIPFNVAIKRTPDRIYEEDYHHSTVWALGPMMWEEYLTERKLTIKNIRAEDDIIRIDFHEVRQELPPDVLVYWKPTPKNLKGQLIGGSLA